jgi:hypothetical protein
MYRWLLGFADPCYIRPTKEAANVRSRALQLGLVLVIALATQVAVTTPAHAAAKSPATHTHCSIVLKRLQPGQKASTVVSRTCVVESVVAGKERLSALRQQPEMFATLLVVFFEHIDFGGDDSFVYGDFGTCDNEGYGIDDMDGVQDDVDGVSSYQLQGFCNVSEKFSNYNFGGTSSGLIFGQSQPWVGSSWNDGGIKSFHMHRN